MTIFAAYKGETPLVVDTLDRVAEYLNMSKKSVRWYTYPSSRKRQENGNGLYVFKFEE